MDLRDLGDQIGSICEQMGLKYKGKKNEAKITLAFLSWLGNSAIIKERNKGRDLEH